LITETTPSSVFSPEDFTEEQRMIAQTTSEYIQKEVVPNSARIEEKDYELQRELLRTAGELLMLNTSNRPSSLVFPSVTLFANRRSRSVTVS